IRRCGVKSLARHNASAAEKDLRRYPKHPGTRAALVETFNCNALTAFAAWLRSRAPSACRTCASNNPLSIRYKGEPSLIRPPSLNSTFSRKPVIRARIFDAADRLDPADKISCFRDGPSFRLDDAHGNSRGGC